ncbi:hypothetical protein KUCAC02_023256 [Chaenocephalus aceratus]|uniref:Uncharacterized protein n=1 Tax=Chaenocephalus aceratus TaxID=36190 RepID=A0ACB9XQS3_CHAAC|nr:hypothetical protein KUCAC02_023256 [Chaenocephalus aceratus]
MRPSCPRISRPTHDPSSPSPPRPESSPKRPPLKTPPRTTGVQQPLARRASDNTNSGKPPVEADPKKKNIRKAKGGIKIEVMHEESQGGSTHVVVTSETAESLSNRRRFANKM